MTNITPAPIVQRAETIHAQKRAPNDENFTLSTTPKQPCPDQFAQLHKTPAHKVCALVKAPTPADHEKRPPHYHSPRNAPNDSNHARQYPKTSRPTNLAGNSHPRPNQRLSTTPQNPQENARTITTPPRDISKRPMKTTHTNSPNEKRPHQPIAGNFTDRANHQPKTHPPRQPHPPIAPKTTTKRVILPTPQPTPRAPQSKTSTTPPANRQRHEPKTPPTITPKTHAPNVQENAPANRPERPQPIAPKTPRARTRATPHAFYTIQPKPPRKTPTPHQQPASNTR